MAEFDEVVRDLFWDQYYGPCCCMGPQNGEPLCSCGMKNVKIVDGHYIQITDLGKVGDPKFTEGERYRSVVIIGHGDTIVPLLKAMREKSNLGLKEARDMLREFPATFKSGLSCEEAAELKAFLEKSGGIIEVH